KRRYRKRKLPKKRWSKGRTNATRRSTRPTKSVALLAESADEDVDGAIVPAAIADYCKTVIRAASKRRDMTLREKRDILHAFDKLADPKMPQRKAAKYLGVSQPLLCKLLKHRDMYEKMG